MKYCENCGKELINNPDFCVNCGKKINKPEKEETPNKNKIECPKCKNKNVTFQVINESQLVTKHHGCLWWIIIGWWWIFVKWIFLTIPALLAAIFIGKRKKITNTTKKVKVCQNCGHTW